jgi:hypothetical protein
MEPKCGGGGGGVAGSQPMSTAVHMGPNKLRRSNAIFNLWMSLRDGGGGAGVGVGCRLRPDEWPCGARWPLSRPLSRNVAQLQVGFPWKIGAVKVAVSPSL